MAVSESGSDSDSGGGIGNPTSPLLAISYAVRAIFRNLSLSMPQKLNVKCYALLTPCYVLYKVLSTGINTKYDTTYCLIYSAPSNLILFSHTDTHNFICTARDNVAIHFRIECRHTARSHNGTSPFLRRSYGTPIQLLSHVKLTPSVYSDTSLLLTKTSLVCSAVGMATDKDVLLLPLTLTGT